ncbi:TetR/AcrR family transcriptional regulator [Paraburkholderia silvatlantica]|uniref:TetR/AcrR family transcriptional regulator n=1 Tax=Paraburkholderia silvatlantica TaxID=321895 RepID=UPI0037504AF2
MRYKAGHREEAHDRILDAAGRGFRRLGFGGIGVDGLAKEAGVTSGAFYGHFPSKAEAFKAAAVAGLVQLREAIEGLRANEGDAWLGKFVEFYMSVRRTCELGESCALQSLTPEVARASDETKAAYETELLAVVEAVARGLPNGTLSVRRKTAWAILSILSGGVSIARSTADPKTGAQIAEGIKEAVMKLVGKRQDRLATT